MARILKSSFHISYYFYRHTELLVFFNLPVKVDYILDSGFNHRIFDCDSSKILRRWAPKCLNVAQAQIINSHVALIIFCRSQVKVQKDAKGRVKGCCCDKVSPCKSDISTKQTLFAHGEMMCSISTLVQSFIYYHIVETSASSKLRPSTHFEASEGFDNESNTSHHSASQKSTRLWLEVWKSHTYKPHTGRTLKCVCF